MKLFLLLFLSQTVYALDADIYFSINDGALEIRYEFSSEVQGFKFSYPSEPKRSDIFKNFPVVSDEVIPVNSKSIVLKTFLLKNISLSIQNGPIISQDTGDTLVLTLLTDTYIAINKSGDEEYIETLNYYFDDKLLHSRDIYDDASWERFLLLKKSSNIINTKFADIIIDTDMPYRKLFVSEIEKSLQYFYEKLGKPTSWPIVFFTYNSHQDEPWWRDGRVITGSPYVEISLGGELDLNEPIGKIVLYHGLFTHEIAHHWNARNLGYDDSPKWVYEGGAEYLTALVSKAIFSNQMGEFVDYMERYNIESCQNNNEETDFGYHCGHMIYKIALENSSHDPFEIYKEIFKLPLQTDAAVLKVFEKYTSAEAMKEIYFLLEREK